MKCGIPAPDFFKKLIENVEWGQFLEILVQEFTRIIHHVYENVNCILRAKYTQFKSNNYKINEHKQ